jgi:hypothetical protein
MVDGLQKASREVNVGDAVVYTDENRVDHNALITCVHGDSYKADGRDVHPCVNLVFVVSDEARFDNYGRQTDHASSVTHADGQTGGGYCWRFTDQPRPAGQRVRR